MDPTHGRNFRQQGPITHFPSENPTVCTGHYTFEGPEEPGQWKRPKNAPILERKHHNV